MSPSTRLLLPALLFLTASCAHFKKQPPPIQEPEGPPTVLWSWDDEIAAQASGPLRVEVHLDDQKARVYKGDTEIAWSYVATGISKFPTPKGRFKVLEKTADKFSNLYGKIYDADGDCINDDAKVGRDTVPPGGKFVGARMAYWMRVTYDGIGLHVGPIPHPGRRASHGCMRMPREAAQKLFENIKLGTPVIIIDKKGDTPPKYVPPRTPKPPASPAGTAPATPAALPGEVIKKPEIRAPIETKAPPGLPIPLTETSSTSS
jgi:hypothetical protein